MSSSLMVMLCARRCLLCCGDDTLSDGKLAARPTDAILVQIRDYVMEIKPL